MNVEIGIEAEQLQEKEYINGIFVAVCTMDEGRERDNTSRKGGLPTLPSL